MLIENMMYFALGLLVAGLIALIILPAVWQRAVRLTKRRIEAATPITMAEFRADKDQLRAEFALNIRRLETTIEGLRTRLAEQAGDFNQKRTDLGALQAEREQHLAVVQELEAREAELRARLAKLEIENTDLAQRLRMRERELASRTSPGSEQEEAVAPVMAPHVGVLPEPDPELADAEAIIAGAGSSLDALLAEAAELDQGAASPLLLAEQLSMEEELHRLRTRIQSVEETILSDWNSGEEDETDLRERLSDIAASVSRLVYAVDNEHRHDDGLGESLFDRVQRFAEDGEGEDVLPTPTGNHGGSVSDRLAALREIRGR